jgi:hypothetical protein
MIVRKTRKSEWLRECLDREVGRWASKSYAELASLEGPVPYDNEGAGESFYQTEVTILERTAEYVHVSVAVDDGGWRAIMPLGTDFLVYKDGRVDR